MPYKKFMIEENGHGPHIDIVFKVETKWGNWLLHTYKLHLKFGSMPVINSVITCEIVRAGGASTR